MLKYTQLLRISLFALMICLCISCARFEKGFLSSQIRYGNSNYDVFQGRIFTIPAINFDGSTSPATVKIAEIRNLATNQPSSEFLQKDSVYIWTEELTADDKTVEDLLKKKKKVESAILSINSHNGEIIILPNSVKVPPGRYSLDIEVSNVNGSRIYKDLLTINLIESLPYDLGSDATSEAVLPGKESVDPIDLMAPVLSMKKVADLPNSIMVKIVDKHGKPFNWKTEVVRRSDLTGLLQGLETYCSTVIYTENALVGTYVFTPFPLISTGNDFQLYYRVLSSSFMDVEGVKDLRHLNIKFQIRIYAEGSYELTVKLPDVTHI